MNDMGHGLEELERRLPRGESLAGIDLAGENLRGYDLTGRDLTGAMLRRVTAEVTDGGRGDPPSVTLSRATLRKACLAKARLSCARLDAADLRDADLEEVVLSGAWLRSAKMGGAQALSATFDQADLTCVEAERVNLNGAHLEGARLKHAQLKGATLREAQLQGAALDNAQLQVADLEGADLTEASLVGARVDENTSFSRAVLCKANLRDVDIRGIKGEGWSGAQIDLDTFLKSRWDERDLVHLHRRGVEIRDLTRFSPEQQRAVNCERDSLVLRFRDVVSPFEAHLIGLIVYAALDQNAQMEMKERFVSDASTARLSTLWFEAPNLKDIERFKETFLHLQWRGWTAGREPAGSARAMVLSQLATVEGLRKRCIALRVQAITGDSDGVEQHLDEQQIQQALKDAQPQPRDSWTRDQLLKLAEVGARWLRLLGLLLVIFGVSQCYERQGATTGNAGAPIQPAPGPSASPLDP